MFIFSYGEKRQPKTFIHLHKNAKKIHLKLKILHTVHIKMRK